MGKKEDDFLKKLLATFKIEAQEHVNAISSGLITLEKAAAAVADSDVSRATQMEIIETIFREAHSLKGAARAVNMMEIESICQWLESIFAALKRREATSSPELFDVLHRAVDTLGKLLLVTGTEQTAEAQSRVSELAEQLERASKGVIPAPKQEESRKIEGEIPSSPKRELLHPSKEMAGSRSLAEEKPMVAETVRIPAAKLDSVLLQTEELLFAKLSARQRAEELREIHSTLSSWKKNWTKVHADVGALQRSFEKVDTINGQGKTISGRTRVFEFLEWNGGFVKSLENRIAALAASMSHDQRSIDGMVDTLLEDMKKVLMFPFASLLEMFPKLVRDLSRDRGKEVELEIQGGDIEIDRRILEEMKDPLIHLIRNCIDHGIEKPAERERKKKPPRGSLSITISQKNGSKVEILIADDGAGVDAVKVRSAAVKLGIVTEEEVERLKEHETLALIFQSGVSTSRIITEVSGRGLGLAIVREKVEKLSGAVSVKTHQDAGTTFRILLPLTLARFRGMLVRVGEHLFVLPTTNVERVMRVNKEEIKTVENRETIPVNGQAVSLVRLEHVLNVPAKEAAGADSNKVPIVILGSEEKRIAFLVDEILDEHEVLVKRLGKQLSRVRNFAGAAVLGSGKVVPIVNVPDLMKSAVKAPPETVGALAPVEVSEAKRKSVLVAEDSITARTLLKNILESAGYSVKTAVDGVDALTALKTEDFDIVVSDVDMPRMSGFDLTAKIRSDKKLADLPLVLVTALESREDRERGIDVGANAYIVKSSFDQSNLLEVIKRLI
jgi:two-component system chemotaxis sensor kinase CheA